MNRELSERLIRSLEPFRKVGLEDFGDRRFSERMDRKFPVALSRIPSLIDGLADEYDLVMPGNNRVSTIASYYFDTPDYAYFRAHHRGRAHRHKVRFRVYADTDTTFLEVKKKNAKGRTMKERIESNPSDRRLSAPLQKFLADSGVSESSRIRPVLEISYKRLSFISKDRKERFSVDFAVEYNNGVLSGDYGALAVIEVKQDHLATTPVVKKLRDLRITESSLSKYCLSLCQLHPELKANRFQPVLRNLQELIHEEKSDHSNSPQ
jgi:hypothetical protein